MPCMRGSSTRRSATGFRQGWPASGQLCIAVLRRLTLIPDTPWLDCTCDRQLSDERTPNRHAQSQILLPPLLPTACPKLPAGASRQGSPRPRALAARTTTSPAQPPSTSTWTGRSQLRTTLHRWHPCSVQPASHGLHLQLAACQAAAAAVVSTPTPQLACQSLLGLRLWHLSLSNGTAWPDMGDSCVVRITPPAAAALTSGAAVEAAWQ